MTATGTWTRLTVTAGLLASAALTVTACDPPPRQCPASPVLRGLAVAVGDRANNPQPSWPAQLDSQLTRIIRTTGPAALPRHGVTFVTVDGDPVIGCVMTYDSSAENGPARKQNRQAFLAGVHQEVRQLHARRAQADPLAALTQASAAAGPGGTVVLMDSGLQTVAPLDFAREDLLDADPATVVAQLRADGELPHLGGQSVILDGIGYTASPQARLDEDQRDHLIVLWRQIVHAGGAAHVQDINTPDTSAADQKLPPVSLVRVPPPNDVALGCNQRTDLSNDGAVGFLPGQTAFRDPASARPVLLRIAQWLRRNPSARAELTGSIAHYGAGGPGGLSAARAQRIKLALISLGAGHGQVTATGIGWGPFPTRASPPDPASDELNRRVVVELTCD